MPTDDLALRRTFLALERTLMAWIRTSTSLLTFGFTIYKFFQYLVQTNVGERPRHYFFGPRSFALCMIGVGITALAMASIDYRHTLRTLEQEHGVKYRSLAQKLAAVMFFLGLGLLIIVLVRG
jgi:putative membrane protein